MIIIVRVNLYIYTHMFIIKLFVRTNMYVYLCVYIYISLCVSVEREKKNRYPEKNDKSNHGTQMSLTLEVLTHQLDEYLNERPCGLHSDLQPRKNSSFC